MTRSNEYRQKALEARNKTLIEGTKEQVKENERESQEQQRIADFEAAHVAAEKAKAANPFQLGEAYLDYAQRSIDSTFEAIEANHVAMLNAFQARLEKRAQMSANAIVQMADPRISLGRTWEIAAQHFQSISYSDVALDCGSGVAAAPVPKLPEFKGMDHLLPQGK